MNGALPECLHIRLFCQQVETYFGVLRMLDGQQSTKKKTNVIYLFVLLREERSVGLSAVHAIIFVYI